MVKVNAYHWLHDFSRQFMMSAKNNIDMVEFGVTHKQIPLVMEVEDNEDVEVILGQAFDFFNWMTDNREGQAPNDVNLFCIAHEVHASQSVGDIVEIEGKGFWMVDGIGWIKLDIPSKEDEEIDKLAEMYSEDIYNDDGAWTA
jgi:hypothetical protein